jgi:hypothetical protein
MLNRCVFSLGANALIHPVFSYVSATHGRKYRTEGICSIHDRFVDVSGPKIHTFTDHKTANEFFYAVVGDVGIDLANRQRPNAD